MTIHGSPLNLLRHPAVWRAGEAPLSAQRRQDGIATGFAPLDQALPDGGWPVSGLAELLCPHWGCGEAELLLPLLRQLGAQQRWLVWINPPWLPFAPALARQGVALEHTLLLRCERDKDLLWAMEQCLGSGSCSLVQGWPARPQPQQLRRLQLAAQKGHSLGLLLRPSACAQQPSPAPLRLELARHAAGVQVRVAKCRGNWGSDWLALQVPVAAGRERGTDAVVSGQVAVAYPEQAAFPAPLVLSTGSAANVLQVLPRLKMDSGSGWNVGLTPPGPGL